MRKFKNCRMLVMDFDGVLTDNSVLNDGDGNELVRSNRSDSLGLELIHK